MSTPYLAEIRIFSLPFAPRGWAQCNGQPLAANQNQGLFSLISTTYGGDSTNFLLPNLQGRVPVHFGNLLGGGSYALGQTGGVRNQTLSVNELPGHSHAMNAVATGATVRTLGGNMLGAPGFPLYGSATASGSMAAGALSNTGGGTSHNNMQPHLGVNICIALQGLFPSAT